MYKYIYTSIYIHLFSYLYLYLYLSIYIYIYIFISNVQDVLPYKVVFQFRTQFSDKISETKLKNDFGFYLKIETSKFRKYLNIWFPENWIFRRTLNIQLPKIMNFRKH